MVGQTGKQALGRLKSDGRLLILDRFVPSLQIVRSLGVARNEVAHSHLLAALFDPRQHGGAEALLRALLGDICQHGRLSDGAGERLRSILQDSWAGVDVQREFQFIDIVVQVTSGQSKVAIGIENKIDAGEGRQQLGRYQNALRRAFRDQASVLVFLTPTGREPITAISDHPVPTVSIGYDLIVRAIQKSLRGAEAGSRDQRALQEIVAHLKENILGEETEVKALVRELWREHGKALHLAMEHRPRLEDIRGLYEALLRERFGDDAYTYHYRSKGALREIKMSLTSWENAGFPFEFMLRVGDDGSARVRMLVWRESYDEHAASLQKWARRVNATDPNLIDEEFTRLGNTWPWRRVFLEEESPAEAILDEQAFDEATAREAAEAVVRLYERLQPHIRSE